MSVRSLRGRPVLAVLLAMLTVSCSARGSADGPPRPPVTSPATLPADPGSSSGAPQTNVRTAAGPPTSAPTTQPPAACHLRDLTVTANPQGIGSQMGSMILDFRNVSPAPCTVRGYPLVTLIGQPGIEVTNEEADGGDPGITLARGAYASAYLSYFSGTNTIKELIVGVPSDPSVVHVHLPGVMSPRASVVVSGFLTASQATEVPLADAVPPCRAQDLDGRVAAETVGSNMGSAFVEVGVSGGRACRFGGYPGLTLLDVRDHPLRSSIKNDTTDAPEEFVLHPGDRAYAQLGYELDASPGGRLGIGVVHGVVLIVAADRAVCG